MKHLNDNIVCAIDIMTSGNLPGFHDLVEISVVPTRGLEIDKSIMPFNMHIIPKRPENLTKLKGAVLKQYENHAVDPYTAMSMFEYWYEKLNLRHNKRIIPLSWAWQTKAPFLIDWCCSSDEGEPYFYDHFDKIIFRDLLVVANYWNDFAYCKSEHFPFTKQRLHFVAQKLGVPWTRPSTTLTRCFTIIETYKKFMQLKLPAGIDLPFNFPAQIDYSLDSEDSELDE
jgi:hypothetical protein